MVEPRRAVQITVSAKTLAFIAIVTALAVSLFAIRGALILVFTGIFLAFVFAYFYLRSLNNGGHWRPPRVDPPQGYGAAVVSLFEKHRPTRVVPPAMAFSSVSWGMYPNKVRRWMGRKTGMDTMFLELDHDARKAYEDRTTGD